MLDPFMPQTAAEVHRQLGLALDDAAAQLPSALTWGRLQPGTKIAKGKPLFPRIETTSSQGGSPVTQQPPPDAQPVAPAPAAPPSPTMEQISIEDFQKIQLKTAVVLTAERVPKSEKLLKLQVDLGTEQRQIVAGIGKTYEPEALIGRKIVIVANLKPAKLMGIESQGMVLAAGDKDVGGLVTVLEDVPAGTKVK